MEENTNEGQEENMGGFKGWIQENFRIIISIVIVIAIAGGIYSYSKRTQPLTEETAMLEEPTVVTVNIETDEEVDQVMEEMLAEFKDRVEVTIFKDLIKERIEELRAEKKEEIEVKDLQIIILEVIPEEEVAIRDRVVSFLKEYGDNMLALLKSEEEEAEEIMEEDTEEMIEEETAEVVEEEAAEEQVTSATTSKETTGSFVETAQAGDGSTHLARRALANYLEKNPDSGLTPEHKIYIEDYLRKNVGFSGSVHVGTTIEFQKGLIQEAIDSSKGLTEGQLNNLQKYSAQVVSLS